MGEQSENIPKLWRGEGGCDRTDHPVDHHRVPVAPVLHGVVDIHEAREKLKGGTKDGLISVERDQKCSCGSTEGRESTHTPMGERGGSALQASDS
jgi:hypothetical protein